MKTWTDDDPKAALLTRKRAAILEAAQKAFLEGGYAATSMDSIAELAGVSVKTLYRHFENKDELFSAIVLDACSGPHEDAEIEKPSSDRPWFAEPSPKALVAAATEYLENILSEEQLALYRVIVRDAPKFPELGFRYRSDVVEHRIAIFTRFLKSRASAEKWKIRNLRGAALTFDGLIRAGIFEDALLSDSGISKKEAHTHAQRAAAQMLTLLQANAL